MDRNWGKFVAHIAAQEDDFPAGRENLRREFGNLANLVTKDVLPRLSEAERAGLFPFGPPTGELDLRTAAGVGMSRGWINADSLTEALIRDRESCPFAFMQTKSGKSLGSKLAPAIVSYWIVNEGDVFHLMSSSDSCSFEWRPVEATRPLRVALKSSAEQQPRFQQIRHPRLGKQASNDYDVLLWLGISNRKLDWWVLSANEVARVISSDLMPQQHLDGKAKSNLYWSPFTVARRRAFEQNRVPSEEVRARIIAASGAA